MGEERRETTSKRRATLSKQEEEEERQQSLRRIRFLRPALSRERDREKTLEPTLVRHSLCKQTLNAPTKPTIVSAHCAIVTKPTTRDLGLCKKLALKVEPHVSISPEMESHILAMG